MAMRKRDTKSDNQPAEQIKQEGQESERNEPKVTMKKRGTKGTIVKRGKGHEGTKGRKGEEMARNEESEQKSRGRC